MKKGFTLVELLIVVVILVTLMSVVFRIGDIGSESEARSITINRIQRFENALSGYYAAFGMYPPVKPHASQNVFLMVDEQGRQSDNETSSSISWSQVNAACRAQPIGCEFPFPSSMSAIIDEKCRSIPPEMNCQFDDGFSKGIGRHAANKDKTDWQQVKIFKFGALSYLLPRYLFMVTGDERLFTDYKQWTYNNVEPCDALSGDQMTWQEVQNFTGQGDSNSSDPSKRDLIRVANISSQAVCARWMASFENALYGTCNREFFGINVQSDDFHSTVSAYTMVPFPEFVDGIVAGSMSRIYYPDGSYGGSTGNPYILDFITINDGWLNELYYYSPPPYQNYMVWSAGKNGKTFPPWVSRDKLSAEDNRMIGEWIKDDIIGQSN